MLRFVIAKETPLKGTTLAMVVSALRLIVYEGLVSAAVVVDPEMYVPLAINMLVSFKALVASEPV